MSSFEVNELLNLFKENNAVKLFLLSSRFRVNQKRILSFPEIILPPIQIEQLAIFCGSLYINKGSEEETFLNFIKYLHQSHFEKKLFNQNGFVPADNHLAVYGRIEQDTFEKDPAKFICKLIELRNINLVPYTAHHLKIFLYGKKNF